jgi:ketosteroid isomerase-like protein
MSQENVEVVREAVDAANRRDLDAFLACLHHEVVWDDGAGFAGLRGVYHGQAEAREWFEGAVVEPWERLHLDVEEIIEGSEGGVLVGGPISGRGRTSGAEAEIRVWQVLWVADGKIARRKLFWARADALEAVGLRE